MIAWNFPYAVACRKIAPALIAGCAIVLKPHEDTPCTALELAKLAEEAGIPPGYPQHRHRPRGRRRGGADEQPAGGRDLLHRQRGDRQTDRQGRRGERHVRQPRTGRKGPVPWCWTTPTWTRPSNWPFFSRFLNCGQICTANERTYVQRGVYEQFLDKFVAKVETMTVGDPLDEDKYLGPKVNRTELEKVDRMVSAAVTAGATTLTGGGIYEREGAYAKGYWYKPTVITGVDNSSPLMREEIFGPVVPVAPFDDFEEGLELANDTRYGLAGYLHHERHEQDHAGRPRPGTGRTVYQPRLRGEHPRLPHRLEKQRRRRRRRQKGAWSTTSATRASTSSTRVEGESIKAEAPPCLGFDRLAIIRVTEPRSRGARRGRTGPRRCRRGRRGFRC